MNRCIVDAGEGAATDTIVRIKAAARTLTTLVIAVTGSVVLALAGCS